MTSLTRPELRRIFRLLSVLALVLGLYLLEPLVRPVPLWKRAASPAHYFWVSDETLGYRARRDGVFHYVLAGSLVTTGPRGERTTARHHDHLEPGGRQVVICVGDSTTFCSEVDDGETTVSCLQAMRPDLYLVNAAVPGFNTIQAERMADEWLTRYPGALVLYTWCPNDDEENTRPDRMDRPPCPTWFEGRAREARLTSGPWEPVRRPASWPWPFPESATHEPSESVTGEIVARWRARLGPRLLVSAFATSPRDRRPDFVDHWPGDAFVLPREAYQAPLGTGVMDHHHGAHGCFTWASWVAPRLPSRLARRS